MASAWHWHGVGLIQGSHHNPQKNYLISLNLLKLFKDIGLKCARIQRILGQEDLFKDFIEKNIELRKNAKSPFEKDLFKLMSNSIYIYINIYIWEK